MLRGDLKIKGARVRAVLGIDAAWTDRQPSGVALAVEQSDGWHLKTVAASYGQFLSAADGGSSERATNMLPDVQALLASAKAICGHSVDLVAIDMPLARTKITGRRASDEAISRSYGGRWASTHSPSSLRPGKISDDLRAGFEAVGYPLRTAGPVAQGLVEVYPHPALIEFLEAEQRRPYKYAKRRNYWPLSSNAASKVLIRDEWWRILGYLNNEIDGARSQFPQFDPWNFAGAEWKAREDMLDAVICAAVGICVLEERAVPFGDNDSAIWVPKPGCAKPPRKLGTIGARSSALNGS